MCSGVFLFFLAAMISCVALGYSALPALLLGIVLFTILGRKRGYTLREMLSMMGREGRKLLPVLIIFLVIGAITGLWRASGTITFFIYYGIQVITPKMFVLVTFLLTCLLSYALGTSFGVVGTAGIILIALARSGGVNVSVTAGAVLAGAYFGDRCSPASSSAALVSAVTGTDQKINMHNMLRTGWLPTLLSVGIYALLSVKNPICMVDESLLQLLSDHYSISFWTVIPAILMLVLPLFHLSIRTSMAGSCAAAFLAAIFCQHMGVAETLRATFLGYEPAAELSAILSGGGVASMLRSVVLVLLTGCYAGLLTGIGALDGMRKLVEKIGEKWGLFPATLLTSIASAMALCNQSIVVVMGEPLLRDAYEKKGASREELAVDLENSGIILSALIPWNIAGSIPLKMLGADIRAIPYAVLLYMIPLCHFLTKRYFFRNGEKERKKETME